MVGPRSRHWALLTVSALIALPAAAHAAEQASMSTYASSIVDKRIDESSSLAISRVHPGIAYTLNDGHDPVVFSIDIATGRVVGTTKLTTSKLSDPEALALDGRGQVWVADTGDNQLEHRRSALYVYGEGKLKKKRKAKATRYRIAYSDGQPHNVESLLIDPLTAAKFVITKNFTGPGSIFRLPDVLRTRGTNVAVDLGKSLPAKVSDGAFAPDGMRAVVRDDTTLYVLDPQTWEVMQQVAAPRLQQGESLSFNPEGSALLLGSEGRPSPLVWVEFDPSTDLVMTRD